LIRRSRGSIVSSALATQRCFWSDVRPRSTLSESLGGQSTFSGGLISSQIVLRPQFRVYPSNAFLITANPMRFFRTEQDGCTRFIPSGDRPISGLSPPTLPSLSGGPVCLRLRASNEGLLRSRVARARKADRPPRSPFYGATVASARPDKALRRFSTTGHCATPWR